ncbi:MAG: hypothetical protein ABR551_02945 [Gemmatimonadales bacterium]
MSWLLLTACAPSPAQQAEAYAKSVAGCYQFEPETGDARLGLPWGIELREEPLEGWPGHEASRLARTWLTAETVADHPFGYWARSAIDSMRTGHPGGGGLDLVLAWSEEGLAGWGRAVGNVVLPEDPPGLRPRQPVRAHRVACPAG